MEVWIYSQDKTEVRKVRKTIQIAPVVLFSPSEGSSEEPNGRHHILIDGYQMGEYASKERARAIMEDIRNYISVQSAYSASYCLPQE